MSYTSEMYLFNNGFEDNLLILLAALNRNELLPPLILSSVGKPIINKEEVKGQRWATWSSVLGPEVNGIWPKYSDSTPINSVDANPSAGVLVTGDDLGLVRLYRFPCLRKGSYFSCYY